MMRGDILLVVAFVLVMTCSGTAVADPPSDLDTSCQDLTDTVIVFVEHSDQAHAEAVLYPGTEIYVAYCGDGEAESPSIGGQTVWDIEDTAGLRNISERSQSYYAVISADQESVVLNAATIRNQSPDKEVTITVQQGPVVQSSLTGTSLLFQSGQADRYAANETAYVDARNETVAAATDLNQTATNINNSSPSEFVTTHASTAETTLTELNESKTTADDRAATLRSILYTQATETPLPRGEQARALESLHTSEKNTENQTAAALDNYRNALGSIERQARETILINMTAGLLAGLVIGAIGGGYRLRQYGQKTQDFSDFRGTDFDQSLLTVPVAIGLALFIGGFALLIVTGIGGVLL